jgi:hypothetical protein
MSTNYAEPAYLLVSPGFGTSVLWSDEAAPPGHELVSNSYQVTPN